MITAHDSGRWNRWTFLNGCSIKVSKDNTMIKILNVHDWDNDKIEPRTYALGGWLNVGGKPVHSSELIG